MDQAALFPRYADAIRGLNLEAIRGSGSIPDSLLIGREGSLSVHYIPFDWVNPQAKVVIVGITPGFTQFINAMREAQRYLKAGIDDESVLRETKRIAAFSGDLRLNLIELLDHFEIHRWLYIGSCAELFGASSHLVQTTSALRHPVFINGEGYNGTPRMTRHPMLRRLLLDYFAEEAKVLSSAIFVPLGPRVSEALSWLASEGVVDPRRVLGGMPHPSPQNIERIRYVLGRKKRSELSVKTNPDLLDAAGEEIRTKIQTLMLGG
jgi:hypothetical protein